MAIVILVALAAGAALVREGPDSVAVLAEPDALREAHEIRHAARAVSTELRPGDTVLAVTGHLIHWYLDRPPPSPIAHPSNLVSADMIGVLVAADRIGPEPFAVLLESRPAFVVRHGDRTPRWLRLAGWATRFEAMLADDYEPFFNEGQITVWRRR